MYGKVTEFGKTQKGTPKLKINGTWVYAGNLSIVTLRLNDEIEYWTKPFALGNGKCIDMLEAWLPYKSSAPLPVATLPTDAPPVVAAPRAPSVTLDEAQLRYVSNCVGSAIASGACKSPADIRQWFNSAKACFE
jgi:hypothetical protein